MQVLHSKAYVNPVFPSGVFHHWLAVKFLNEVVKIAFVAIFLDNINSSAFHE